MILRRIKTDSFRGRSEAEPAAPDNVQVLIPALNEESTVAEVILRLRNQGFESIRVVDNGSTDRTRAVASEVGATVLTEKEQGYGAACLRGCKNLDSGIRWILFCDADGCDDLDTVERMIQRSREYDLILGDRRTSRTSRSALTIPQNLGNGLAVLLIRLGWGYQYRDLGPLRLIRRSAFEGLRLEDRKFGWTVEMQIRALEENLRIRELPTGYTRRKGGHSKISGTVSGTVQAGTKILWTIFRLYFRSWFGPKIRLIGKNGRAESKSTCDDGGTPAADSLVSIVIPVFNEAALLPETLASIASNPGAKEVLVVDGGSTDGTIECAQRGGATLIASTVSNRALQMNLGAQTAKGDILLFLHGDTRLPPTALHQIRTALSENRIVGGAFSRRYDHPSLFLRFTCLLALIRSRWLGWNLGDQGIFVRAHLFREQKGFSRLEKFEDLEFSLSLRRFGRTVTLDPEIVSSGRRFGEHPVSRTLKDMLLAWRYLRGRKK